MPARQVVVTMATIEHVREATFARQAVPVLVAMLLFGAVVVPTPAGPLPVGATHDGFAIDDEVEVAEDTSVDIPVLQNEIRANLPVLSVAGENVAWDGSGPYLVTVAGTDFFAFRNVGEGAGTAAAHTGWDSLAGVAPADVSYVWDDLELDSVTHSAPWVYEVFAELDGNVGSFVWSIAGTAAAEGTLDVINVVIDDAGGATQGAATAYGQITFTGPAGAPFYEEIRDRSCGTGVMWLESDTFVPTVFADPETYQTTGGMYPTGYQVVSVTQAQHGQVQVNPDGTTVRYTPDAGFDGPDSFTYAAEDCDGIASTATVNVTVGGDNDPVDLSLDLTIEGLKVILMASATDPECRLVSSSMTFGDGDGGGGGGASGPGAPPTHCVLDQEASRVYAEAGTYTVCFTAVEADENEHTVCDDVTVLDLPVDVSMEAAVDGLAVVATGHAVDTACLLVSGSFTFGDGSGGGAGGGAPGAPPTHCTLDHEASRVYAEAGTYTVCFKATQTDGTVHTACTDVTVQATNQAPVAAFLVDDAAPLSLVDVRFTDASTDDGGVTAHAWDVGDGGTSTEANPVHAFAAPGVYTVCLVVNDVEGLEDTTCQNVDVQNRAPSVTFAHMPLEPVQRTSVSMDADASDPDGDIAAYAWTFGDGDTSSVEDPSHVYADDGVYHACVTVTDDWGDQATHCVFITVINLPPVAAYDWLPGVPTNLDDVAFGDLSTDPDGHVVAWSWDFGDGNTSSDMGPMHRFGRGGTYHVALTVTDDDGATATTTRSVDVLPVLSKGRAQGIVQWGGFASFVDTGDVVEEFDSSRRVEDTLFPFGRVSVLDAWAEVDTHLGEVGSAAAVHALTVHTPAGTLYVQQVDTALTNGCFDDTRAHVNVGGVAFGGIAVLPAQEMAPDTVVSLPGDLELSFHVHTMDAEGRDRVAGMVLTAPGLGMYEFAVAAAGMENCPSASVVAPHTDAPDPSP